MSITTDDFVVADPGGYAPVMELWERIRIARTAKGLTQTQLGKLVGVEQPAVASWEKQGGNRPNVNVIADIAKATGFSAAWISHESGPQIEKGQQTASSGVNDIVGVELAKHVVDRPLSGADDLPILGRAKGGTDAYFIDQGDVVGYTVRPKALLGVREAYAIEVWDSSMEPALEHGWTCWVHPHKPIRPGDRVVIQLRDGQAWVKRFVKRTAKEIVVEQFNPRKFIHLKTIDVLSIHLIIGNLSVRT